MALSSLVTLGGVGLGVGLTTLLAPLARLRSVRIAQPVPGFVAALPT